MNTISISDIQKKLHKLDDFDIIEVIDKKRHTTKGYFLNKRYQALVEFLVKKQDAKKELLLKEFKNVSKNITKINPNIDILKLDAD